MRAAGVVCEYNPFHRGHQYLLKTCRELLGADTAVVCALSGDFVQRGEAAVFDKFARAEAACRCGADLVLELPLPWCLSPAEGFARGGVGLLGALGVSELCFGSETGELEPLQALAALLTDPAFQERVRARLTREPKLSYASARQAEAACICGDRAALLGQPNNILAVEYLKAIRTLGLDVQPVAIRRQGSAHDRDAEQGELRSASEIRRRMAAGGRVENDIPPEAFAVYETESARGRGMTDRRALETAMLARLRLLHEEDCLLLPDAADGLGRRLYRAIRENGSPDEICAAAATRRYALARIRRMLLCACLEVREGMSAGLPPYARVLALNARGRAFLRAAGERSTVPILTKPAAVRELDTRAAEIFTLGARAHDFACLAMPGGAQIRPDEDWRKAPAIV